eukprot:gnl/Ergobibamus_cyprinoides/720.p1 GENE.gnl/Ergobibamus_cyprinoides/720~~gnl/Ergobibamus_cyprinoides/720.p1  ORF type:complete len:407 (+),score=195.71 gnl/Ergobibamus_cyprinoides/720:160-1221(+)
MLNFCSNNYLGLCDHPEIIEASKKALDDFGFGLSSVRFICGTQSIHKQLEQALATFHGFEDCALYTSCFDANGGLFEVIGGPQDIILSDALNHASIIDGMRLAKALPKAVYRHMDMEHLEELLVANQDKRQRLIITDGTFSMDGDIAPLAAICDLAEKYNALVIVDDSHSTGVIGATGRGTAEHCGVQGRVDIQTHTLGKAMGGASGGYIVASARVVELLRNKSRPLLFSNTVAPAICGASLKVLELVEKHPELVARVQANGRLFREKMAAAGFELLGADHAIVPVLLRDAILATKMGKLMHSKGIYVTPFSFPVVPRGQARIRVQLSAAHTDDEIERCVDAFIWAREQAQAE